MNMCVNSMSWLVAALKSNEWMNEWMNERMIVWMNESINQSILLFPLTLPSSNISPWMLIFHSLNIQISSAVPPGQTRASAPMSHSGGRPPLPEASDRAKVNSAKLWGVSSTPGTWAPQGDPRGTLGRVMMHWWCTDDEHQGIKRRWGWMC